MQKGGSLSGGGKVVCGRPSLSRFALSQHSNALRARVLSIPYTHLDIATRRAHTGLHKHMLATVHATCSCGGELEMSHFRVATLCLGYLSDKPATDASSRLIADSICVYRISIMI